MKRTVLVGLVLFSLSIAQVYGMGINVSAFLPANGSLSHPVSPLSFRDVGFTVGKYAGVSGAIALNNINGMGLLDENKSPLRLTSPAVGPFYTALGSLMVKAILPVWRLNFEPGGGVFGYYLINPTLRSGVIDSYIAGKSGYQTVDSSFAISNNWGWGFLAGGMISLAFDGKIGMQIGAYYYIGSSPLELTGTYRADGSSVANPVPAYLKEVLLDFSGIEFIIGGTYEL